MPSKNKALIRRLFAEVWNKGNLRVAGEIFSYDYTMHDPIIKHEPGIQSYERHVTQVRATFPDIKRAFREAKWRKAGPIGTPSE